MINYGNRLVAFNRIKKGVKASDQKSCGNVIAEYKDKLVIIEGTNIKSHEYIVPKSIVDHYDGNNLYLNKSRNALLEFTV